MIRPRPEPIWVCADPLHNGLQLEKHNLNGWGLEPNVLWDSHTLSEPKNRCYFLRLNPDG